MITQMHIIFFLLAGLFTILFLIFLYYLWNEQSVENQYQNAILPVPDKLAPERARTTDDNDDDDDNKLEKEKEKQKQNQTKNQTKQVFNVSENTFTFKEAPAVCKALGGELATLDQLADAYRQGADWCNYGWVEGQMAFYPTQKSTWDKLQRNSTVERRNMCGKPQLNGGYFDNPNLRFGVTCYGIKPSPRGKERVKSTFTSDADAELEALVNKFKKDLDNELISLKPFNHDSWSGCKTK
jgi:hypothetical protein